MACVDGAPAEQAVLTGRMGNAWVLVDDAGDGYRYQHLQEFTPGLAVGDRWRRTFISRCESVARSDDWSILCHD